MHCLISRYYFRPASKGGMDHVTWSYYALSVLWMLIWLPECNAGNHTGIQLY